MSRFDSCAAFLQKKVFSFYVDSSQFMYIEINCQGISSFYLNSQKKLSFHKEGVLFYNRKN